MTVSKIVSILCLTLVAIMILIAGIMNITSRDANATQTQISSTTQLPEPNEPTIQTTQKPKPENKKFEYFVRDVKPEDVPSWNPNCPVHYTELTRIDMSARMMNGKHKFVPLIIHSDYAEAMVTAFRQLYEINFPIITLGGYNCRATVSSSGVWSQHSHAAAVDINYRRNPYVKGDLIIPPDTEFLDRSNIRPGMITDGHPAIKIFEDVGFEWGGYWASSKDPMHFSSNGL